MCWPDFNRRLGFKALAEILARPHSAWGLLLEASSWISVTGKTFPECRFPPSGSRWAISRGRMPTSQGKQTQFWEFLASSLLLSAPEINRKGHQTCHQRDCRAILPALPTCHAALDKSFLLCESPSSLWANGIRSPFLVGRNKSAL